jgi:hypothetical protein
MRSTRHLAGTMLRYDEPDWGPLESLVGPELAPWFMWMHSVELEDDAIVHAYKHVSTRRYLHLACDGRAFVYTAEREYREVLRLRAIVVAFDGWEALMARSCDVGAVRAALGHALNAARVR